MYAFFTQLIGLLGAALGMLSFQFKDNNKYYTAQALSGLCFAVNFFLLGAYTAALLNLINLIRGFGFAFEKGDKPNKTLITVCILYIAATALTYNGPLSLLVGASVLVGSYGMWSRKPTLMRILQIGFISPAWLLHNVLTASLGGIVCEVFNMLSVIVYFIRIKFFAGKNLSDCKK